MNRFQNKYFNEKFVDLLILSEKKRKKRHFCRILWSEHIARIFIFSLSSSQDLFYFILFYFLFATG